LSETRVCSQPVIASFGSVVVVMNANGKRSGSSSSRKCDAVSAETASPIVTLPELGILRKRAADFVTMAENFDIVEETSPVQAAEDPPQSWLV